MDIHTETALISAVLALAIAIGVVLRTRKRRAHWLFVMFATNVAVWYFATFLEHRVRGPLSGPVLGRVSALMAVLLPQTATRFLRSFRTDADQRPSPLDRWATYLAFPMLVLVASPYHQRAVVRAAISAYVVGLLIAAVSVLYSRGRQARSRLEQARTSYLVVVSIIATLVTTADLLPFIGLNVPPVGSILVLAVLYMLSEVMERSRLIDLFELAGRFFVLTALALVLAGIYYLLVDWQRQIDPYFLNAIVASLVILILFDPLRAWVEQQIARFFFRERFDLERAVADLRRKLSHVLELDAMGPLLIEGLSRSRRVTHAAVYLADADRRGLDLFASLGGASAARLEIAAARPLLDLLAVQGSVVREQLEREEEDRREGGDAREAESQAEILRTVDAMGGSVVLPLESDAGNLLGVLAMRDDRMRDAFSPDDVQILRGLAVQAATVVENSKLHARIKERDRLAALGEMAAGLAHEIRNPLGSIKAAAQFMENAAAEGSQQRDFLGIIVEEVERLNRVVSSFLDYAQPYRGNPSLLDVAQALDRTLRMVRNDLPPSIELIVHTEAPLPPVRMDAEHLRQVVLNLVRNAIEAMEGHGTITVQAVAPPTPGGAGAAGARQPGGTVEIVVRDTGHGIPANLLPNLFIPFVTTKARGTGLGLAICQRLVESAGGRIEVRSSAPSGTTFAVVLPAADATSSAPPTRSEDGAAAALPTPPVAASVSPG